MTTRSDQLSVSIKLGRLPAYKQLLKLGKERKGAIFLDIGCCCERYEDSPTSVS